MIRLRLKRITPRLGERLPDHLTVVPLLDTGGAYRPKFRPQDPSKDPHEPYGGESSSRGNDHGWSGCTMSSSALALAYATGGDVVPWGGDMRHRQSDLEGGTDLNDAAQAFAAYGETLTIRSGKGWANLADAHAEGRAIVIQGIGEVPGAGDFAGGHACAIGTETASDGDWLFGDPLCSDWQWIPPGKIRAWAEAWQSSIAFAVTVLPPAPEPEPDKPPAPAAPPGPDYADGFRSGRQYGATAAGDWLVGLWIDYLGAPRPGPADRWGAGSWADAEELLEHADPCAPIAPAMWARSLPVDAAAAGFALDYPAAWGAFRWPAGVWRA